MWPKIKKKVSDFLLEERGSIKKTSLIRMGVFAAMLSATAASTLADSKRYRFAFDEDTPGHPCHSGNYPDYIAEEIQKRSIYGAVACAERSGDQHTTRIYLDTESSELGTGGSCADDIQGNDYTEGVQFSSDEMCEAEAWQDAGIYWLKDVDCEDFADNNKDFLATVTFDDLVLHENSISMTSADAGTLTASHEHSAESLSRCNYDISLGTQSYSDGTAEFTLRYAAYHPARSDADSEPDDDARFGSHCHVGYTTTTNCRFLHNCASDSSEWWR